MPTAHAPPARKHASMAKPRKIECLKPEPFYSDLKLYKCRGRCRCFKLTCVEVAAQCCRKAAPARRCRLQLGVAAPSIDLTRRICSIDVASSWARATSSGGGTRLMLVSNGTAFSECSYVGRGGLPDEKTHTPNVLCHVCHFGVLAFAFD